ncbi:MAG TPA: HAMP domain-containing sensor histidine kinase [Bacillota bacterium]|nr:HAMP domain-containing sensor histidine kinase [Bacillota bacterium]
MLLIAMCFLVFALFMVVRVLRGYQAVWLSLILFTFGCCLVGLVGLYPRFGNYQLDQLLSFLLNEQPNWVSQLLENFSLYDLIRFRLWSAVGYLVAFIGFSISYSIKRWKTGDKLTIAILGVITLLLLWYYEPVNLFYFYNKGGALLSDSVAHSDWETNLKLVDNTALGLVIAVLIYGVRNIFEVFWNSTILQKRIQALCVGIGNSILCFFFVLLFCVGQTKVLNAHTMGTSLLPLGPENYPVFDAYYLQTVPLAALIAIGALLLSILRYGFLGTFRITSRDLDQQIIVANQAVRMALHSFKNRFLAVQMAMDMAADQLNNLPEEKVERACTQIQWAKDVCADALTRLDALHIQAKRLQVNPRLLLLSELWEEARRRCLKSLSDVTVTRKCPDSKIYVWGDREHLVSVLENILQNALDAMAENRKEHYSPQLIVELGREYEWAYVRITDNGPGISKENLHKVFRPFFTTKPTKTNWGLGLTYCHRVIKTHHGFINLHSKPGVETTVEIVLRCRENTTIGWRLFQKFAKEA